MSYVTNIIVAFSPAEEVDFVIGRLNNRILEHNEHNRKFVEVDRAMQVAGTRALEVVLIIGAFNYLDVDQFMSWIREYQWEYPEDVQVLVKDQEDDGFDVFDIKDT